MLKADTCPVFDPPLPPRKLQAIQRLGFGTLNKVLRTLTLTLALAAAPLLLTRPLDSTPNLRIYPSLLQAGQPAAAPEAGAAACRFLSCGNLKCLVQTRLVVRGRAGG